ncbi:TIGR02450 family Trp-rich protein [Shewanella sp.]|uniref:TIGR02450 family Trp-rich protein n=1 Tax=Shewanella sp. TaxID=50422 RepID=UPI004053D3F2
MNNINPKKLLNSKWTAVAPVNKEKHFMITEIEFDEEGIVVLCSIEAVISKHSTPIDWHDLQDDTRWVHGWK